MAQTTGQNPSIHLPFGLRILSKGIDTIILVTTQSAFYATGDLGLAIGPNATEVVVALAIILGLLKIRTNGSRQATARHIKSSKPANRATSILTIKIDHSTRVERICTVRILITGRYGLILNCRALPDVGRQMQRVITKTVFISYPTLLLIDTLTGVVIKRRVTPNRVQSNTSWVCLKFGPFNPLWILGILPESIGYQCKLAVIARPEGQLDQSLVTFGRTVITISFSRKTRSTYHVANTINLT